MHGTGEARHACLLILLESCVKQPLKVRLLVGTLLSLFELNLNLGVIIDSHIVVRNNTERSLLAVRDSPQGVASRKLYHSIRMWVFLRTLKTLLTPPTKVLRVMTAACP